MDNKDNTIVLVSSSPRRKSILERFDIPFVVTPADIDETVTNPNPSDAVKELAVKKVQYVSRISRDKHRWYLAADTMVLTEGIMLGKPSCIEEAKVFLKALSGKKHEVITGIAFFDAKMKEMITGADTASVWFASLTDKEIDWYLASGEWKGAAGAYRIQERGESLVERIDGSYSNIMGLPIRLFFSILLSAGYPAYNLPSGRLQE
ncbi:MAG: Maf family protein [Spirochaetia bacterium]|jgi:septum formation protein|nr:Maf family protein [Spirochaetia bacterium]